jgi:hypothetical protein
MSPASKDFSPIHPCPKPGLCLDLLGRAEGIERDIHRHEEEIKSIRNTLVIMQQDLHTLVSQAASRDRMTHAVIGIFGALLIFGMAQFGATIWWGSRLQTSVETLSLFVADHEERIRSFE